MSDDPSVTVPAELVERWERDAEKYAAMGEGRSASHKQCRQIAKTLGDCAAELRAALVDAAERPACSHRWRAFPPDGKRYGYWRCDECGKQNEGPMCLVTTKERGVYRDYPEVANYFCFLAGFNPGAAHMADREADAWDAGASALDRFHHHRRKVPGPMPPPNPFRLTPDTEGETR